MTPAVRERDAEIAAIFGPDAIAVPRVFRVRLRVLYRDGHLVRFFVDETGRVSVIGCAPAFLSIMHAGTA